GYALPGSVLAVSIMLAFSYLDNHLVIPLLVSLLAMATGAFMDSSSSNLTRPAQMYFSQFLLAFGSTFFLGPSMALGISHVRANPRNLVSFSVLFGICNNLGG
ncbi:MFS transporter, partial [Pseudomonas sp. SIMBA_059]